jgi:hypothetical protein
MKSLYRHKPSGDLFALETDDQGNVLSSAGPLLTKDIDPELLNYDDYFTSEIKLKSNEFELLSKAEYEEILIKCGFSRQKIQRHLF